jgi:hypothetical protein
VFVPYDAYTLPVYNPRGQPAHITYHPIALPSPPNGVDAFGTAPLFQTILAYLTEIWLRVQTQQVSEDVRTFVALDPEGEIDFSGSGNNNTISNAGITITKFPDSIDVIFGEFPLLQLGHCGFQQTQGGIIIPTAPDAGAFQITITATASKYPIKWVNHLNNIFYPDSGYATGFWWKLKPGVEAVITCQGAQAMTGVQLNGLLPFNPARFIPPS